MSVSFVCRLRGLLGAALLLGALPAMAQSSTVAVSPGGETVYEKRCSACHDHPQERIPSKAAIQGMTARRILRTLDFGVMMTIASPMPRTEREAVANYLGRRGDDPGPPPEAFCKDRSVKISAAPKIAWNGWSPAPDNTRFVPANIARLTLEQVSRLKVQWAFGFAGDTSAFAQPTIIDGQVFVGSAGGLVHALRADTGCLQWVYHANGPIRSALVVTRVGKRHVALFGDLTGWFYALDATTGEEIWKKRPEEHEAVRLSGVPIIYQDTVLIPVSSWEESRSLNPAYACCTFRGSITALRIRDGSEAWKTYTVPRKPELTGRTPLGDETWGPSGVPVWSSPTLDTKRRLLYVTTGNNYSTPATDTSDAVMALDPSTGRIVWSTQTTPGDVFNSTCNQTPRNPRCPQEGGPDFDFGAPAMLLKTTGGRDLVVAGQKSGVVFAFDPDRQGAIVWQTRVGQGGLLGGIEWGMASDGERIYAGTSDALLIRGSTSRSLDPQAGGGLTALNIADGSKAWYAPPIPCGAAVLNCSPAQQAAVTAIAGVVFSGALDGHLRAYSTRDGKVIWDLDTAKEYDTVNGIKARGGAIDGPGAIVVGGMVFVNSGYTRFGGAPGNVLLALAPGD